ncbi:MAG: 5-formyltetrahydrofolate cyclo-ligase [Actinomycetota bacterium]|jgi:5-formyltetrahydrofolate cyclo-ligase
MSDRKLTRAKRELRDRMKTARDAIDPHRREVWSSAIVGAVHELPEMVAARTVTAYLSFGSEIAAEELIGILDAEGKRVAVPVVRAGEIVMVTYKPGDPTLRSEFGMPEPGTGEEIPPPEVDAVVIPGLAFDAEGFRLGYGGGFYDRYLRRTRPETLRVGICFSEQVVEDVPHGDADERVDRIVTQDGTISIQR